MSTAGSDFSDPDDPGVLEYMGGPSNWRIDSSFSENSDCSNAETSNLNHFRILIQILKSVLTSNYVLNLVEPVGELNLNDFVIVWLICEAKKGETRSSILVLRCLQLTRTELPVFSRVNVANTIIHSNPHDRRSNDGRAGLNFIFYKWL